MPTPRNIFLLALIAITAVSAAHAVKPSAKPQEVFAPYWTSEPGWETELQLKNNLSSGSLTVTPILRLASGEEIALEPLTIASNASASVEISQALLQHSPMLVNQAGSYGSVVFRFTSFHPRNLTASAEVSLHGSPIGFHVAAYPAVDSEPFPGSALEGSREGIWWQPRVPGSDVLILSNSAQKTLAGTLWLSDAAGKRWSEPLALAAHQTVRLDLRELVASSGLTGQYGGIRFEVPANAGALGSVHLMYDELAKSSSALEMSTRTTAATVPSPNSWTTRAPMLALRNPDPAVGLPAKTMLQPTVLVRNTTAGQVAANLTLAWRGDSGKGQVKLPPLNMAPFATQQLQIGAMQKQLGIPDDAHWALITLTSNTAPNGVIAIASSYDASGRYNLQSPFSPTVAGHFAGGEWQADSTHNHILSVTNSGQKPAETLLSLHYANGAKTYELQQTIQPGDQMSVNMAELIHSQAPDRKGNVLPADLTSGTYDVQNLRVASGGLVMGGLTLDQTFGFQAPPPYPNCCSQDGPGWDPDEFIFQFGSGGLGYPDINATDSCNGTLLNISSQFPTWESDNTSVALVSKQKVQAEGVGSTFGTAAGELFVGAGGYCAYDPAQERAPISVQPTISGPTTLWWFNGLSLGVSGYSSQVTLTASASSGSAYQWAITSGSDKVSMTGSGQTSTATFTSIGQSKTLNDVKVTVTVAGVASAPFGLTVRAPYKLIPDPNVANPIIYYPDSTYAWYTDIYYQILDNLGTPLPVVLPVMETFGPLIYDYSGTNWQPGAAACLQDPNSDLTFYDHVGGERTGRSPTPVYETNWTGVAVEHWSQDWRIGTCTPASGPRVQSDTIQKWTDHALHTNIISPNP